MLFSKASGNYLANNARVSEKLKNFTGAWAWALDRGAFPTRPEVRRAVPAEERTAHSAPRGVGRRHQPSTQRREMGMTGQSGAGGGFGGEPSWPHFGGSCRLSATDPVSACPSPCLPLRSPRPRP